MGRGAMEREKAKKNLATLPMQPLARVHAVAN
jgi:hypothetical protein